MINIEAIKSYKTELCIIVSAIIIALSIIFASITVKPETARTRYNDCLIIVEDNEGETEELTAAEEAKRVCYQSYYRRLWKY